MAVVGEDRHIFVDGQLVSEKISRVVQSIKEYEPELDVQWIPPGDRSEGEAAFAIIHRPVGNAEYVMFYVQDEKDFDERVLYRIIVNDQRNGKKSLSELEAWEASQKLIAEQEYRDKLEEAHDMARFVLRSPKHKIKINKDLVINDFGGGRLG
jgi:hypothetical protein